MKRFVLRIDDVSPAMAWSKFAPLEATLERLQVPALLGVVPDCRDPKLSMEAEDVHFWDRVRGWRELGWTIAQHGYTHVCDTTASGLWGSGGKSEFAGHDYAVQSERISAGKRILQREGVWQPYFMAPSHSFDLVTVRALAALDFTAVTDGDGLWPYRVGPITFVPQLFSGTTNFGSGLYTLCLHVNHMTDTDIDRLLSRIARMRDRFISFETALEVKPLNETVALMSRRITRLVLPTARKARTLRAG